MFMSASIDWLSVTVKWNYLGIGAQVRLGDEVVNHVLGFVLPGYVGKWEAGRPMEGYVSCHVSETGVRVNFSSPGSPNGVHVVLGGKALQNHDAHDFMSDISALNPKVARIDVALDVKDSTLNIGSLYLQMKSGAALTRARKYNLIEGSEGQTLYVGSRTSERFLRVYDKAAQMKTEGAWVRMEMEYKGDWAVDIWNHIKENGESAAVSMIDKYVLFRYPAEVAEYIDQNVVEFVRTDKTKVDGHDRWLWEVALKAVLNYAENSPEMRRYIAQALMFAEITD